MAVKTGAGSAGIGVAFCHKARTPLARMMSAFPRLPAQDSPPDLIFIDSILPTMPVRHREHDSGSLLKLSAIGP
jgi:hypothetical protein